MRFDIMVSKKIEEKKLESDNGEKLSPGELARFLRNLASFYKNPILGNRRLSTALSDLARNLTRENTAAFQTKANLSRDRGATALGGPLRFESFSPEEIGQFLANPNNSKLQLIELASGRFGIPRAKLMRLRTEEVRERIKAALLHENSLQILSEEAQRGGTKRSS
jgi:hypothetical protein